jgi:tetratricopeptide (TPR) repeat protein/tRNA A-37 threonylcarbamoyl transferase component Bud32
MERRWIVSESHTNHSAIDPTLDPTLQPMDGESDPTLHRMDSDPDPTLSPLESAGLPGAATAGNGSPSARPRFRILRPHARGGLGAVYLALDGELHREVALKEIQSRHADHPDSRARFLLEAEITGRLEHPGVVPVYSLGHYPDGRPYYAMRFIRGDSLKEAIARFHQADVPGRDPGERTLALHELLGQFVAACNAIAYAHSKGVLHRDIKPDNIMLGKYGETLVVDWGLAKLLGGPEEPAASEKKLVPSGSGSGTAPTQMGSTLGTPVYMSPEQAAGELDRMGPASDVYSLGVTLYQLLTGHVPFNDDQFETMREKILRGEFPPPHQVKRDVPRPLEAVCLKAMAVRPADRYDSPRDLANDVEHWLADEPLSAYREPWTLRARRWLGRHRTVVTATASAVLVAVVGLTAATVLLTAANDALDAKNAALDVKNEELRKANERERAAKGRAEKNWKLAQQREREANEQRGETLGTLQQVVLGIEKEMRKKEDRLEPLNKEELGELRQKMLREAITRLQNLARSAGRSSEANRSLVDSHLTLGDILLLKGDLTQAGQHYQKAGEVADKLASANPADRQAWTDLARAQAGLGDVSLALDRPAAARDAYSKAWDLRRELARRYPARAAAHHDLFVCCYKLGDVSLWLGQTTAARDRYRQALKLARTPRDLSIAQERLGDANMELEDFQAARDAYGRALKLARNDRPTAEDQRRLLDCTSKLGGVLLAQGETAAAEASYGEARKLAEKLTREDPHSPEAQRELMRAHLYQGDVLLRQADEAKNADAARTEAAAARDSYRQALDIAEALVQGSPQSTRAQRDLALALERLGDASVRENADDVALNAYRKAQTIALTLGRKCTTNVRVQRDLARVLEKCGDVSLRQGADAEAARTYGEAQRLRKALDRTSPRARAALAMNEYRQGALAQRKWEFEEALRCYRRAQAMVNDTSLPASLTRLPRHREWVKRLKERRDHCEEIVKSLADLEYALKRPHDRAMRLLWIRVVVLARRDRPRAAAESAARLRALAPNDANNLYDVASAYARCITATNRINNASESDDARERARQEYGARAVESLRQAVHKGFINGKLLREDPNLEPLRSRADFKKLLDELDRAARPRDNPRDGVYRPRF